MAKKPETKTTSFSRRARLARAIANNHGGRIIIPRASHPGSLRTAPISFPVGHTIPITAEAGPDCISRDEWEDLKQNNASVRNYLDAGLLEEVFHEGPVNISHPRTNDPPIPVHLQREEETAENTGIKASVRRGNLGKITVTPGE